MNNVTQAVSLFSTNPAQALTQINLKNHDEKVAFKYGALYHLAAQTSDREKARKYHRIYRHALRYL